MKRSWNWVIPVLVLALGVGLGLAVGATDAQQKSLLVAKKVAAAPTVDGVMEDAWKAAAPLTVKATGGRNLPDGSTEVSLRAVYTADMVYVLVQYRDPTESLRRSPWVKQADGSWQKLKDPNDKGGDNNLYY